MLVRELHPLKAELPMLVTPSGITMLVSKPQFPKARSSIVTTVSGNTIVCTTAANPIMTRVLGASQSTPSSMTKDVLPAAILRSDSDRQPTNGLPSMVVSVLGKEMVVRELHPLTSSSPMLVTPSGMTMLVRELQPLKAE